MLYRLLYPEAIWRLKAKGRKVAYLTFDDGPIPEVTPWVLDTLASKGVKATFFMVGDNARRNPDLVKRVRAEGHSIGNHTMHHTKAFGTSTFRYMRDITEAALLIDSSLFRPPHGMMHWSVARLIKSHYNVVMYDVVTRDYNSSISGDRVFNNVKRYVRNGSIIVFHDSLKAEKNMRYALPKSIDWLLSQGYELHPLPM